MATSKEAARRTKDISAVGEDESSASLIRVGSPKLKVKERLDPT